MTSARATALLARAQWWVFAQRVRIGLRENRLLTATIAMFLGVYAVAAYLLVARGIDAVHKLPLLGPLLTERLVFLLFFCFFVMLVISNATITGMGLFRKREAEWQIALPLHPRSLVMWKTIEGMLLASWGLVVLSAPILAALGRMYGLGLSFYLVNVPAIICLVTIAANVSTWLLLFLVRWARRWMWWPLGAMIAFAVGTALYHLWMSHEAVLSAGDVAANVRQVLRHTEVCIHPMLPSSWVAEAVLAFGRGAGDRAWFFNLTLLSYAFVSLMITAWLAARLYMPAWNRMMAAGASSCSRKNAVPWFRDEAAILRGTQRRWWQRMLGLDRASCALLGKDMITFVREPTQWGQSALIFGLLFMYTTNLRRLGYDTQSPVWSAVLSYLNVLVSSLAISTLTTRFIFPQFSLEGQRLWMLGLSPLPLERILSLKLRLSAGLLALLTTMLVLVSCLTISLPAQRIAFFIAAIILLSYGLTSLALSLGALLPNFREPNPARIVSGFGGTLCLITSFLYILLSFGALVVPAFLELRNGRIGGIAVPGTKLHWELAALAAVGLTTFVFGVVPYWLARKRIKSLAYLGSL